MTESCPPGSDLIKDMKMCAQPLYHAAENIKAAINGDVNGNNKIKRSTAGSNKDIDLFTEEFSENGWVAYTKDASVDSTIIDLRRLTLALMYYQKPRFKLVKLGHSPLRNAIEATKKLTLKDFDEKSIEEAERYLVLQAFYADQTIRQLMEVRNLSQPFDALLQTFLIPFTIVPLSLFNPLRVDWCSLLGFF